MHLNWMAFALPLFLLLMLLEFLVARKKKLPYFKLHNSIANISIGIAERLADVFVTGVFFFVYKYLHQHFGVFNIRPSVVLWVTLLIFTDFIWYWYHRLAHEINILWAAHVVHHQSEDFNYTVSARITVFQAFIRTGFWAILPILGFPPAMIISMLLVHGIYPFFIHTRLIGKLGLLEYVLVTPSHHRVHHASNERYMDKNYGDVFIIWDKLFGTFQKEEDDEEIEYGLNKPLNSYSFLWQHFHFYIELWFALKEAKGFKQKWQTLFGKPLNFNDSARGKAEKAFNIYQRHSVLTAPLNKYVLWQIGIAVAVLFLFLLLINYISVYQQVLFTGALLLTLINCGAIMEQKRWIFYIEYARLFLVAISVVMFVPVTYTIVLTVLTGALLLYYFNEVNERYLNIVYRNV
jgi:alkylglycerol monooxygenase